MCGEGVRRSAVGGWRFRNRSRRRPGPRKKRAKAYTHRSTWRYREALRAWRGAALDFVSSIGWQQAAPGSVSTRGNSIGVVFMPHGTDAMGNTSRWVNPGSRLLPTDRAAISKAAPLQARTASRQR